MKLFGKEYDLLMIFPRYIKLKDKYEKLDKNFTKVSGAVGREITLKLKITRVKGLLRLFRENNIKVYTKENKRYKENDILEKIYEIIEKDD